MNSDSVFDDDDECTVFALSVPAGLLPIREQLTVSKKFKGKTFLLKDKVSIFQYQKEKRIKEKVIFEDGNSLYLFNHPNDVTAINYETIVTLELCYISELYAVMEMILEEYKKSKNEKYKDLDIYLTMPAEYFKENEIVLTEKGEKTFYTLKKNFKTYVQYDGLAEPVVIEVKEPKNVVLVPTSVLENGEPKNHIIKDIYDYVRMKRTLENIYDIYDVVCRVDCEYNSK